MVEFVNIIRIDRPIGEVFEFLLDLENLPKWNYFVINVTRLSAGSAGIGAIYHQVRKTDEQDLQITELEWGHKIVVKVLPPATPDLEMSLTLTAEGNHATQVRDEWKLITGWPGLVEKIGAARVKAAAADNLAKLKDLLEEGQVVLQDGREAKR